MRVLLVEDDYLLGDGVKAGLKQAGFAVDWVQDGLSAKLALETETYALLVLDIGLPKLNGMELLKWLRAQKLILPVLMLTARDTLTDRVAGLNAGADDYLVKPFDLDELVARLNALSRRSLGQISQTIRHGDIALTPTTHEVTKHGRLVELTSREFSLLHELLMHVGQVKSREQLEQHLYGWGDEVESNSVEVHVHHLRKKLGAELIRTLRGVGYVIDKERAT
ncbi:MAG TPA: DNA-binding response regulator [Methylophilaceae bacterium]|nr:DNA-binding response regulator [Methylophilaceae bacterium]HAJ72202.1 DNA-binding response regulator [Methylophilaceae bacterium]